jgi:uncharacterized small protein (DUF1192 family)
MKELMILGSSYLFPEIRDEHFESLREEIRARRDRLQDDTGERRVLGLFPRKMRRMDPGERVDLMVELVDRYDELMNSLTGKIGSCKEVFVEIGEGMLDYFGGKAAELQEMEKRRSGLVDEARAAGLEEVARGLEGERERIKGMTLNLTRASVLIIRKLRHALTALETLVEDETAQQRVLASLRGSVSFFRKTQEFTRDLDRIEEDIAAVTRLALNFDTLLRDNLGPLALLVDEVSKVDARVADSLAEIERLSAVLEAKKDLSAIPGRFDDRIFDVLVHSRARQSAMDGIIAAMSDPRSDLGEVDFEVDLEDRGDLDFSALAENMRELVRRGLADLRGPRG